MENAVEKAIRLLGGSLQATIKTGIHSTTLWKWAKSGRVKDGQRALIIARAVDGAVTLEELVAGDLLAPVDGPRGGRRQHRGKISARYCASERPDPAPFTTVPAAHRVAA
jgi:DNA-binding transcriptional regulator YdaS (Cro superfamily)